MNVHNLYTNPIVAYVTCAWQRDWSVVLNPNHFESNLNRNNYTFPLRIIVLNNFTNAVDERNARRKAARLVELGLVTHFIHAPSYLDDSILESFGLVPSEFWKLNPYFSTSHLAALHWLQGKADWLFFLNGDVWLERPVNWIPRALGALAPYPDIRGLNLCRNIYVPGSKFSYADHCSLEDENLWIANSPCSLLGKQDFSLSDHAYLIKVSPAEKWVFTSKSDVLKLYYNWFPEYASPCFEMLYLEAMERCDFKHAALKFLPGIGPITKHKSFPKSKYKLIFYELLGRYRSKFRLHRS